MNDRHITEATARDFLSSAARQHGLKLEGVDLDAAVTRLTATLCRDEAGEFAVLDGEHRAFTVENGRAVDVPPGRHILDVARQFGQLAPTTPASSPSGTIVQDGKFAGRTDGFANLAHGFAAARDAEARAQAENVLKQGNPWEAGRENRTAQGVIANTNPELAKRMKAEAGVTDLPKYNWK